MTDLVGTKFHREANHYLFQTMEIKIFRISTKKRDDALLTRKEGIDYKTDNDLYSKVPIVI